MDPAIGCKRPRDEQDSDDTPIRRNAHKGVDSAGRRVQLILDARNCHKAISDLSVKYPAVRDLKKKFDTIARNGYLGADVSSYVNAARRIIALIHYRN